MQTAVSDDGLSHLAGLRQLQLLVLAGTKVTDAGLKHLHALLNLFTVNVRDTLVTDAGAAAVASGPRALAS